MKLPIQIMAKALNLSSSTLRRWIRQGKIPIQIQGTDVIFSHSVLRKWTLAHKLSLSLDREPTEPSVPEAFDSLVSVMKRGKVFHRVSGNNTTDALRSAVDCVDFLSAEAQNELYDKLIAREHLASTGIGSGIAIPHPKDPISQLFELPVITTCFLEKPVDFNAIDDQPVFVCFLLVCPTVQYHLHLLSRLSYCIRNKPFVAFLEKHPHAMDLYSRVMECEELIDYHGSS